MMVVQSILRKLKMSNQLMTEPPLDPPETAEDRKDSAELKLYRTLEMLKGHLDRDDNHELELQHMACQARDDDEIDRDMHGEDGSLDPVTF